MFRCYFAILLRVQNFYTIYFPALQISTGEFVCVCFWRTLKPDTPWKLLCFELSTQNCFECRKWVFGKLNVAKVVTSLRVCGGEWRMSDLFCRCWFLRQCFVILLLYLTGSFKSLNILCTFAAYCKNMSCFFSYTFHTVSTKYTHTLPQ